MTLAKRISAIEKIEKELVGKSSFILKVGEPITVCDYYLLGAINRTLAQSRGFRDMIWSSNFPCAAVILRTQIDTAMRINGIKYLSDFHVQLDSIMKGEKTFNQLKSKCGNKMNDHFLRTKLEEKYGWINSVYKESSDFVHLSFRHLYTGLLSSGNEDQLLYFSITGYDAPKSEEQYFEICDTFFAISKIATTEILKVMKEVHSYKPFT